MTDSTKLPIDGDGFPGESELPEPVRATIIRLREEAKTSPATERALAILRQLLQEVS